MCVTDRYDMTSAVKVTLNPNKSTNTINQFEQFYALSCLTNVPSLWLARCPYLEPFPKQALVFTCLHDKYFENTVGKGEIARNEQFLFFPQCFLPAWKTFCYLDEN